MNETTTGVLRDVSVSADITHAPTLNFAMEQAGVPIVTSARVTNSGSTTLEGLQLFVGIDPEIAPRASHPIGKLRPGESVDLGAIDVRLQPGRLRSVLEADRAELAWEIRNRDAVLASGQGRIDVLAYNEWAGLRAPPALLASFVTPNDPVIAGVLRRVRDRLRAVTGDGALSGYQLRSEQRVREMVQALYETLQSLGISYVGAGELRGRRAEDSVCGGGPSRVARQLPRRFRSRRLVPRADGALAADRSSEGPRVSGRVADRGALPRGRGLRPGAGSECHRPRPTLVLRLEHAGPGSAVPLAIAERVARAALSDDPEFLCALDVAVARRDRYRPLPLRDAVVNRATSTTPSSGSEQARAVLEEATQSADAGAPEQAAAASADTAFDGRTTADAPPAVADRFRQWRDKLLDLSVRNKLLNFRDDTKGALRLDVPDIAKLEDLLASDQALDVHPRPIDARDERDAALTRARGGDEILLRRAHSDMKTSSVASPQLQRSGRWPPRSNRRARIRSATSPSKAGRRREISRREMRSPPPATRRASCKPR